MADNRALILFDTATRAEYYDDVHKVLAMPSGSLLIYQYRDIETEGEVVTAAASAAKRKRRKLGSFPTKVLVVYAQWTKFARGDGDQTGIRPPSEMLYQALRFGTLVALWREGEQTAFQFRLDGQPKADSRLLEPLITELAAKSALPYDKWVAFSDAGATLDGLDASDPLVEWQRAVDRLVTPPMQFTGDKFIRFQAPARNRFWTPSALRSRYPKKQGHRSAREHRYVVPERCEFGIHLWTHEPPGTTAGGVGEPVATFEVSVPEGGPLLGPDPSSGDLRRESEITIGFESMSSAKSDRKVGTATIKSPDALPHLPRGITFAFDLKLAAWKRLLGLFLAIVGAASIAVGGLLTDAGKIGVLASIATIAGGVLLSAAGTFLLTGAWSFKT